MTIDTNRMRVDAAAWLYRANGDRVTRENAVSEESMALDVVECADEIDSLRSTLARVTEALSEACALVVAATGANGPMSDLGKAQFRERAAAIRKEAGL